MAFFRANETVTITKKVAAGSAALVESEYSLIIKAFGTSKIIPAESITFSVVQPTESVEGSITCVFTVDPAYSEGSHIFELHQVIPGGDTWTRKIGSARVKVEKYPTAVLYI